MKALIELSDNEDGSLHIEAGAKKDGINDDNSAALTSYDLVIKFVRLLGTDNGPALTELVETLTDPEEEVEYGFTGDPNNQRAH